MVRLRQPSSAVFLLLESLALAAFALTQGQGWLLPVAGLGALLAAVMSRGLWLALAGAATAAGWWGFAGSVKTASGIALPASYTVSAILLGIVFSFLGILSGLKSTEANRSLKGRLARLSVILHFIAAGIFLADQRGLLAAPLILGWGAAGLSAVMVADILRVLLSRLYTVPEQRDGRSVPGAFFFFRWLGPEWRACLPVTGVADEDGLKLSEMWMWSVVSRSLPWLGVTALLLAWVGTCVHEVGAGQQGVAVRLGAFGKDPLSPGLHFSLPWPMGDIRKVETGKLHQLVLGFGSDTGKPILWERSHYVGEELCLVGGGDDFLSISVPIHYRISDPCAYLRSSAGGEDLLRNLARRSLLHLTIGQPAAGIMTRSREPLRRALQDSLQQELDLRQSGIEVCDVFLRDIHPPVAVAPAFQEVVSAMEEKEAIIHEGEEYELDRLPGAKGESRQVVLTAEAAADGRLLKAGGESDRFLRLAEARRAAPRLYDVREGFQNFDQALAGSKKAVFDEKLRARMPTHLDLRRALNPKLMDNAPPAPEPLIPDPQRAPAIFDLNVEGFH